MLMMILMMSISGCQSTPVIDSFCLWAKPISLTKEEIRTMTDHSKRQIDNFNRIYDKKCINDKG